jgi:RNA:NAD 2'-phosphotransferase (TPT1/KptA family)
MIHLKLFEEFITEGYFDLENKDYILYHATPKSNVESIKKNGIKPSLPSGKPMSQSLVWMADSEELAREHASSRMKKKNIVDDLAVIVIKLNPSKDSLFKALSRGIFTTPQVDPSKIVEIL